jgi:hypothetical protein
VAEEQRYSAVQADIKRLLDQAANDKSAGGMVGLGATWLAAELFARNEQGHKRALAIEGEHGCTD